MLFKESPVYSILNNKCPHCHKGDFFETNNPYDLKKFSRMNDKCSVCNEDFRREPGYYFGATYVSYALTVAFGIGLYIILAGIFDMDTIPFIITLSVLLILLMPLFYRSARLIWINFFVRYKKENDSN